MVGEYNIKAVIIGGDKRSVYLSALLQENGVSVKNYGLDSYETKNIPNDGKLYELIEWGDIIIGGTPLSHNGVDFNAPYSKAVVKADDVLRLIKPPKIFFAGFVKENMRELAARYGTRLVDLLEREELALLNAIPTAEGAIRLAIENTDITLHGANVLLIGYGRVGRVLGKKLCGIGASVFAVTFSGAEYAAAQSFGVSPVRYADMENALGDADVILNTVPKILIDRSNIKFIRKNTPFIDISSPPHGIDYTFAKEAGLAVIFSGSLPGAVAPRSSALYNMKAIFNVLEGEI
ncbi:dipicolinate synthase subunit A [Clostridia bacterium]|nr:dipicolinate synthase subunit A [Clostridia bacterium]